MRVSRLQLMLISLALGLVFMRESRRAPGSQLEESFVDWLATNTVRTLPPAPVTLVEINDASLGEGHTWPWSPLDFTLFLQAALPFGPTVIAIEPVLLWDEPAGGATDERATKNPQYEKILHDFLLRAPQVLLGAQLGFPEDADVLPPLQPVLVLRHLKGAVNAIPEFTIIDRQPKEEFRLAPKLGFTNVPTTEGPVRNAPLLFRYRGEVVPSFVLQAIMLWHQLTPDDVQIQVGSWIDLGGKGRIPIDDSGAMRVYWKSPCARLGFDDLLLAAQQREAQRPVNPAAEKLTGAIALLARTDQAARALPLPNAIRGTSGELAAAAMATIQNRTFIRRLPLWADVALLCGTVALTGLFPRWSRVFVIQLVVTVAVIYLLVSMAVFSMTLVWLPLMMPGGLLIFSALFRCFAPREIPPASAEPA